MAEWGFTTPAQPDVILGHDQRVADVDHRVSGFVLTRTFVPKMRLGVTGAVGPASREGGGIWVIEEGAGTGNSDGGGTQRAGSGCPSQACSIAVPQVWCLQAIFVPPDRAAHARARHAARSARQSTPQSFAAT
ncbi:MAG TPA: hypothetical protein VIW26_11750 [Gemmatimonadales bacterium]|jgi:hypothetical protein